MRNSSEELTVVVLTEGPFLVVDVEGCEDDGAGLAFAWAALEEFMIVVGMADADESVVCWMSLPCSVMRAGPSLWSCWRSWGTILDRTRSFTGCFELDSEYMSMSNWIKQ